MTRRERILVAALFALLLLACGLLYQSQAAPNPPCPNSHGWCWDAGWGEWVWGPASVPLPASCDHGFQVFHGWCWDNPAVSFPQHGALVSVRERWSWSPMIWPDCQRLELGSVEIHDDTALQPMLPDQPGFVTFHQFAALYESGAESISHGVVVPCPVELCL